MPKPSVSKELSKLLIPRISGLGFAPSGAKRFARVTPEITQLIFIHVGSGLRREFMIEYCALLAFEPHLHPSLAHGGRFPPKLPRGLSYRADTDEALARSLDEVEEDLPDLTDWLQASATLEGFMRGYEARLKDESEGILRNGHTAFTLACGSAAGGDMKSAKAHLDQAFADFRDIHRSFIDQFPAHDHWAPERIERCEDLAEAIRVDGIADLFERWTETSLATLKLTL
jgi:hypothetical protein